MGIKGTADIYLKMGKPKAKLRGPNYGKGFQGGRHAASPQSGKMHRATGGKGVNGDYAAASPDKGFILSGPKAG